jgi:hypothetical protein
MASASEVRCGCPRPPCRECLLRRRVRIRSVGATSRIARPMTPGLDEVADVLVVGVASWRTDFRCAFACCCRAESLADDGDRSHSGMRVFHLCRRQAGELFGSPRGFDIGCRLPEIRCEPSGARNTPRRQPPRSGRVPVWRAGSRGAARPAPSAWWPGYQAVDAERRYQGGNEECHGSASDPSP